MKKIFLLGMMMCFLAVVGCKKSTACWYPIDGGHINLDNVSRITSEVQVLLIDDQYNCDTIIDGVISKENINAAISKIKNKQKEYERINYHASIIFDNFTVKLQTMDDKQYFPNGWTSDDDIIKLLKLWLSAKEDVDSML
jgi:hypothetical protein